MAEISLPRLVGAVDSYFMPRNREVCVYLTPGLMPEGALRGHTAIVIDVLRATTSMIHALAAGAKTILPTAEIDDARHLAGSCTGKAVLAGERNGTKIPGFDLGNSPADFKAAVIRDATLIMCTTNGTPALIAASAAEHVLIAAFVNFSAVCEQLESDSRPIDIICSGRKGTPSFEDTLLAGAIVDHLCETSDVNLNDAARLAWDSFENQGEILLGALEVSSAGEELIALGLAADLRDAVQVDRFNFAAELRRDPLRVEVCSAGIKRSHWPK
ncbi:MAG: 2-phosphosulfolactate phosphatase [Gemmataceae bacterium]